MPPLDTSAERCALFSSFFTISGTSSFVFWSGSSSVYSGMSKCWIADELARKDGGMFSFCIPDCDALRSRVELLPELEGASGFDLDLLKKLLQSVIV